MSVLLLVLSTVLVIFRTGDCKKYVEIKLPEVVDPRVPKVIFECNYNLDDGDGVFSVTWFKEDKEFFKYTPNRDPSIVVFDVDGIKVNKQESNDKRVVLEHERDGDNWDKLGGIYECQVTGEGPKFEVKYDVGTINVGVLPQRDPIIEGLRSYYDVGDNLTATCISAPSYPPAQLTFFINDKQVDKSSTRLVGINEEHIDGNVVSNTRLGLSLQLQRHDFNSTGSLNLVCRSILPRIPGSIRQTNVIVFLTASNEKLAQEAPTKSSSTITFVFTSIFINYLLVESSLIIF